MIKAYRSMARIFHPDRNFGLDTTEMISISYLSTVNTLTSSFNYIYNGAVIIALNVCHIIGSIE